MDANNANRTTTETRPPSATPFGTESSGPTQPLTRPTLNRVDSRTAFPQQLLRPGVPPQAQPRPQFQPGGPVTSPPQLGPRPGAPPPRGPVPTGPQQQRPQQPPLRPSGPHSIAPQQGLRPLQSPTSPQSLQRGPLPNNLQFGPRQPPVFGTATNPVHAARPQLLQQFNGAPRNGVPGFGAPSLLRQPSESSIKGLDSTNTQNKPVNLDNQSISNESQNVNKSENGIEMPGAAKGRSYSIAAAPGSPSPFKLDEDRRKSVSSIGGKIEEFTSRSPTLGLIQEGKIDSKDNIRSSKESIRSEISNDGAKDIPERPESRLSGSKMTESFVGSLSNSNTKKKIDDDEDVVLQNNLTSIKNGNESVSNQNKNDFLDRSPSLTRSDDSPEPKQFVSNSSVAINKSQRVTPEPQRPKTPKMDIKQDMKFDSNRDAKSPITSKSPVLESKPINKKPTELNTSITPSDSKKSTPRKVVSAPKTRPKEGDNDSGVDESTQGNDLNGSPGSPNKNKVPTKLPTKEKSSNSLKPSLSRSSSKSATAKTPENPLPTEKKKVPMNKIQVGSAPSPNIKTVKSKIGSLDNATYKPGGGKVKIENRKLEFSNVTPKIAAKNDAYTPSGGSKKIITTKLEWNAKSKVGSLQNAAYKPGGGDKKIETVKLDFKDKAKPKVASTVNITHKPGGGAVKDQYYMSIHEWSEEERPMTRCRSARAPRTPRALSPRRKIVSTHENNDEDRVMRNNERNRRPSMARPASARDPPRSACSRRTSLTQRPAFTVY
ncbi:microtubule-associated protein tau isoform X2 [Galleria mellonella]|uniref:Microtubule-associated protein tau isoform X2 n=1 Tax=Galleria mellonella TaxID=7137 RepID=A0A6J3BTM0_GALME|nr:microtubule-associated protein tau isoform X2 [Galleria mellonella]